MPLNVKDAFVAVKSGVAAVCAMCEHYWNGLEKGAPSCGQKCGGPASGGVFEKYRGPVSDLSSMCFVCAAPPTHSIRVKGKLTVLGCCRGHVDLVNKLQPIDKPAAVVIVQGDSGTASTEDVKLEPDKIKLLLSND